MTSVGFLHTAAADVAAARALIAERAPWLRDVHLVDESLADGSLAHGSLPGRSATIRLAARVGELAGRDVDVLVCTHPALLAEVTAIAARSGLPVVGMDQLTGGALALVG